MFNQKNGIFSFNKQQTHKSLRKNADRNYRIITEEQPVCVAAEHYRRVKVSLDFISVDRELRVMQITSSTMGEGKTTALLNIAVTYAEDQKRVLLIDLDLRRPKLHRAFKLENRNGLTDYLAGNISLEQAIKHTDRKIDLLNSGSKVPYPTTLLGSEALATLIEKLRGEYDMILLDTPPVLSVTDCCITSKLTDGSIFIVSQKVTDKNAAKEAVSVLRQNNVNLLGVVFTEVSKSKGGYGYYYTYY